MATARELLQGRQRARSPRSTAPRPRRAWPKARSYLDVREPDEYEQGAIARRDAHPARPPREPGRGHRSPTSDTEIIVVLRQRRPLGVRGRARSAELGYTNVVSLRRRLQQVEGRGPALEGARSRSRPSSATATSATCCCPRSARPASRSCSTPRCCCSAPAASARPPRSTSPPPASARSASSTWTSSTRRTSSARSCTTSTASATARSTRPRRRSPRSTPT